MKRRRCQTNIFQKRKEMSIRNHVCSLPGRDLYGFPKLHPSAPCAVRLKRGLQKFMAMSPSSHKTKEKFRSCSSQMAENRRYVESSHFRVFHPFSLFAWCHETVFFFTWLYSLISDPLLGFYMLDEMEYFRETLDNYLVHPMQLILIFFLFFVGYVDNKTKNLIVAPRKVAWHYLTTYFLFDVTATGLTFDVVEYVLTRSFTSTSFLHRFHLAEKVAQIFCYYVRLGTVINYLQDILVSFRLPRGARMVVTQTVKMFIFMHFFTCLSYGVTSEIYVDHWPKDSWFVQAKIDPSSEATVMEKYLECLLVTVTYIFGANHSMYDVSLPGEQACLSMITLFGRLYTLFLLADVLKIFGIASVSESNYEQELIQLEAYMITKNLPADLRSRLVKYYEYKLKKHYFNEPEILSILSEHLRTELFLFSARKLIKKVKMFRSLSKTTLINVLKSMQQETFSPRDVIIQIGTCLDNLYFIESGTVAVINARGQELSHLGDGDVFGLAVVGPSRMQKYMVQAVEATEVFFINRTRFLGLLRLNSNALNGFEAATKRRFQNLERVEEEIRRGGNNILSDLHNGTLLERLQQRPTLSE